MYPENYTEMSAEEKKAHWTAVLYRGMRWAGEGGDEEISIFDKKLISDLRAFDHEVDEYLPQVLSGLAVSQMERPDSFLAKVNGKMGTCYEVDWIFLEKSFPKSSKGGGNSGCKNPNKRRQCEFISALFVCRPLRWHTRPTYINSPATGVNCGE